MDRIGCNKPTLMLIIRLSYTTCLILTDFEINRPWCLDDTLALVSKRNYLIIILPTGIQVVDILVYTALVLPYCP